MSITVAYMRISDKGQEKGNGLEQQRISIMAWAQVNKVHIDEWVTETKTGTTADREQIQVLLSRAKKGEISRLVIDRVDRLGRRASVSLTLRDAFASIGVDMVFAAQQIADDAAGKFMFTLFSGLAEYQRSEWLGRMKQCHVAAVRNKGTYQGGRVPPIGYRSVGNGKLAVDTQGAKLVSRIFALRAERHTMAEICEKLAAEGFVTSNGTAYGPGQICKILKREATYRALAPAGSQQQLGAGVHAVQPAILETPPYACHALR